MANSKSTAINAAKAWPKRHNRRERKVIETANVYSPTTASDWTALDSVTTAPSDVNTALDNLAAVAKALEAADPSTIITTEGDIIIGDGSADGSRLAIGTDAYVLKSNGTTASWGQITDESIADGEIRQNKFDNRSVYEEFIVPIISISSTGTGLPGASDGDVNTIDTGTSRFTSTLIGAASNAAAAALAWTEEDKLDIVIDAANGDGNELNIGITSASPTSFTVGTDDFYMKAKFKVTTVAGTNELVAGFRKAEAHQAAMDDYDELVGMNIDAGTIKIESILNDGATSTTSTTDTIADGEYAWLYIKCSDTDGLSSANTLANSIKANYNSHIADTAMHTTAADTDNAVAAADATDLTSLITLVTELLTDYDAHEGDAEQGSGWSYHAAQEDADVSLTSAVAPTDLAECIARLNDMKSVFNTHDADGVAHGTDTNYQESNTDASRCSFQLGANDDTLVAPTTTTQFTFDDDEVVIPFIRLKHNATTTATCYLQHFEVGRL